MDIDPQPLDGDQLTAIGEYAIELGTALPEYVERLPEPARSDVLGDLEQVVCCLSALIDSIRNAVETVRANN